MHASFSDIRQSERDLARAHALGGSPAAREPHDVLSSSEHTTRQYKASESVQSAFAAEGFGSPPAGLASIVADYVNMATRSIPIGTLASMAPGSGNLGTAASAGVTIALGSLSSEQREVMKAGGDPTNSADMLRIGAKLGLAGYAKFASAEGGVGGSSGGRFAGIREGASDAGKSTTAIAQQINVYGRMSGGDYATHLGFTGEKAREFAGIMNGTSGTFRNAVAEYKRVMDDPNATPEQKDAAGKKAAAVAKASKNKKDQKALPEVQKMFEKLDTKTPEAAIQTPAQVGAAGSHTVVDQKAVLEALRKKRSAAKPD